MANLPEFRTIKYAIWKTCERLQIRPPGVKPNWDENDILTQADMLAFTQIRDNEDAIIRQSNIFRL